MNIKIKLLIWLLALFSGSSVFATSSFVSINDSVAGESLPVRISGLFSQENFTVDLHRPDQSFISLAGQADSRGVANLDIYGLHVQKAGEYELEVLRSTGRTLESFVVFPGVVSAYRSNIELQQKSIVADGEAEARFLISLQDAFGNPVVNEKVQVFSSRNEDKILAEKVSNQLGQVSGKIASRDPGVSTISAVAGNTLIFQKPELVFFWNKAKLDNVGSSGESWGQYLKAQLFEDGIAGDAAYFSLENMKTEVVVGETLTVKVVARDENGDVAQNYLGTVRFSSSDDRAELPTDYQFTLEDQGQHTFFLAVTMETPGSHTLAVHDLSDFRIFGELEMSVTLGGGGYDIPMQKSIVLLTPRPGTYRSSRVTITGEAVDCEGNTIRLVDGPTVLSSSVEVDARGNFVYQTPGLADGVHIFQGICVVDAELVSNQLQIRIDRAAPEKVTVEVTPTGCVSPGGEFTVTVHANEPLSKVDLIFQGVLSHLEAGDGVFEGSFVAPKQSGQTYPLGVTAADLLGNELEYPGAAVLETCVAEEVVEPATDEIAPVTVTNVSAESGEGKVTLLWSPADDNEGVENYRVEYGCQDLNAESEEVVFDQVNVVPDNRTQWYIDNISDNEKCFFQVVAIDAEGNESPPSNPIESLTLGAQMKVTTFVEEEVDELEDSGRSTPLPFIFAIVAGLGVLILSYRRRS
ncbi:hypothetical protein K9M41_00615 [Candidatus Gracilibacteria bacterium]|nr:hypothetical protein [Candidatus Gracilibacteria bacterium]